MTGSRLRRLVRSLLCGGVSTLPTLLAACSSAEDPTSMPLRAECIDAASDTRYAALTVGPNADGIAIGVRDASGALRRLPSVGTPCGSATDRDACNERIDQFLKVDGIEILVLTLGDEVRAIDRRDLFSICAPIESLAEAATLLTYEGNPLDCGQNNAREEADGWVVRVTVQKSDCTNHYEMFTKVQRADGVRVTLPIRTLEESDTSDCVISGRRPSQLAAMDRDPWMRSAGACFDEICRLESAAVLAFDELARDFTSLGAPTELLARLGRAKNEETAHAAITSELAKRLGGKGEAFAGPCLARVDDGRPLLLRLAIENAIEGCVREAYGALVAAFQASHTEDVAVRAAFARIALEETEHAALSLDLADWLDARLDGPARLEVARARERAFAELCVELALSPSDEVSRLAGMPTASEGRALLRVLAAAG